MEYITSSPDGLRNQKTVTIICSKCDCSVCEKPRPNVKTGDEIVQ